MKPLNPRCRPRPALCTLLVALLFTHAASAAAPAGGKAFTTTGGVYDLDVAELNLGDALTAEAWIRIDPACPENAVIIDKLGPATGQGIRLETAPAGKLRLVSSAPVAIETSTPLPPDEWVYVVATFDPRE
jgi:hypothetical protein